MKLILVLVIIGLITPFTAWVVFKPIRVLAPSWVDSVSCINSKVCIDDKSKYSEALQLYEKALDTVSGTVGPFKKDPNVIFCTKLSCFQSFGFNKAAAQSVGKSGIVISPRGWKFHYVQHEMIHHRQAEELGVFAAFLKPEWLIEGMAYSLSNDPRDNLAQQWQQARSKFDLWLSDVGNDNLWKEAKKL